MSAEQMRQLMSLMEGKEASHPLARLKISDIDIDDAKRHFDVPLDGQFSSHQAMVSGFRETKKELISLFGNMTSIPVWRAIILEYGWKPLKGKPLGRSWAWDKDGACYATGITNSRARTYSDAGDRAYILSGSVSPKSVDWAMTVACNTFQEREQEIVVFEGEEILLHDLSDAFSGTIIARYESIFRA